MKRRVEREWEMKKRGGDEEAMGDEEVMGERESGIERRMMRIFVGIGILMWQHLKEEKRILDALAISL